MKKNVMRLKQPKTVSYGYKIQINSSVVNRKMSSKDIVCLVKVSL